MSPLVIGHAGAAGEAPANTLAAVAACLASGADAMEIDVRLSADRVPILLHDETLDRTTGDPRPVRDVAAAELAALDAGAGQAVPALKQVLDLVAGRLVVMCELKATPGDPAEDGALVDQALAEISAAGAAAWTAIHSFSPAIVARSRRLAPSISAALIAPPTDWAGLPALFDRALQSGAQALSLGHGGIDPSVVRAARLRQLTLLAWTADTPADWERLVAAGVDGIITNTPTRLRAFLAGR